ncbi:DUF1835 domain-containing protein [Bacillus sp. AG4(2022)]|uniref:DUF1835 domain-containing protein n=1 Tax=Bacillus sp. AG4(2022) TaxID=2962594 RepID=UPI00288218CD|nr:DUF1835 domain-containing protein [Bacillus sp. AG4(2022)]MDT0162512.1 DUF1835 domain-containing protein [Bacillus sp. AG4(2022)]
MSTRIRFPFVYFYAEPNVVFVYKINRTEFLDSNSFRELEKQTYEMAPGEDFSDFYHENHQPLEGRGYFMSLENHYKMIKIINRAIQKHKKETGTRRSPSYTAVHIAPSESAAGSIRVMLPQREKVISQIEHLGIGPLWKLDTEEGKKHRADWMFDHINYQIEDFELDQKIDNMLLEIADIPEEVPIYIWAGENADEQTNLRYMMTLLKEMNSDIFVINSTGLFLEMGLKNEGPAHYTSQIEPDNLPLIFERGKGTSPLSEKDRKKLLSEWEELARTHSVLRIWENGNIVSVQEDHFDSLIVETIKEIEADSEDGFVKAGTLVGAVTDKNLQDNNLFYLEYRIRELTYNGIFELRGVPKSMLHYRVKLRHEI